MNIATEFLHDADNVYRTKHYIVKQKIKICADQSKQAQILTEDTYYLRTFDRDLVYKQVFRTRGNKLNGVRLKSSLYTRTYID